MLDLEENLKLLDNLTQKINKLEETTNIEALKSELSELRKESSAQDFWQDTKKSSIVYAKIKSIEKKLSKFLYFLYLNTIY